MEAVAGGWRKKKCKQGLGDFMAQHEGSEVAMGEQDVPSAEEILGMHGEKEVG